MAIARQVFNSLMRDGMDILGPETGLPAEKSAEKPGEE